MMEFRIVEFISCSPQSMICFPLMVSVSAADNFVYVPIHDRSLNILGFQMAETEGMVSLRPDHAPPDIYRKTFAIGDFGPVVVYDRDSNTVHELGRLDGLEQLDRYYASSRDRFGYYYVRKLFEGSASKVEAIKSHVSNAPALWRASETRYNQKRMKYWDIVDTRENAASDESIFSTEFYLREFRNKEQLLGWLTANVADQRSGVMSKWVALYRYAVEYGYVRGEEKVALGSTFLTGVEFSDRRFLEVFGVVADNYFQGEMRDFQDYLVDSFEDVKSYVQQGGFGGVYAAFHTLKCFVADSSDLEVDVTSERFIENCDYLVEQLPSHSRYVQLDPYHSDWVVDAIISLLDDARRFPGLAIRIFDFACEYVQRGAQNEETASYLREQLLEGFVAWVLPQVRRGIPFPNAEVGGAIEAWMVKLNNRKRLKGADLFP